MSDEHLWEPATDHAPPGQHEIELRMRAVRTHVPALRALVTEWAMRENHDLDFIDDVRLAVDEVFAIMLANCSPFDTLTARLLVSPGLVELDACVPMTLGAEPPAGGLSLRVLQALADGLDYRVSETTHDEHLLRLRFTRRQPAAEAR